ncbi:MAG: glycosyl transferase family 36 [Bacteroides sp. SM23_62]|nr:MAG: glycosyl transferase family 36 [Bacteroides sp. SM23_62]
MKRFETRYGYFSAHGKEFIIKNPHTPKPWVNVISNGNYGLVISQVNGGFSWLGNSNLNRITRWSQDLIQDCFGKYIYLRDEDNGEVWSPTFLPVAKTVERFECCHGIGYTKFHTVFKQIEARLRIFIPFDANLEIWTLKIRNHHDTDKKIGIYTYLEWCLGFAPDNHREFHKSFIDTSFDSQKYAILAKKRMWEVPGKRGHWNSEWPFIAYFACIPSIDGFTCDKQSFIGRNGTLAHPRALKTGGLDGSFGKWSDAIASVKKVIVLKSGEEKTINFLLGVENKSNNIYKQIDKYSSSKQIEKSFQHILRSWDDIFDQSTVETPDKALNLMTNIWLKYQAISGRLWGRAAYYQQSGAYGFRDQLQDSQIFLYMEPELTKRQILLHAQHQFKDGHVLHWWHNFTDQGHDTSVSDDLLWLPFVVIQYLKETADWSIFDEKVKYLDSDSPATLLNHCLAAINLTLNRFSKRGLPLILHGDWNDGLNAVGVEGKGESIWLGHFLYYILQEVQIPLRVIEQSTIADYYQMRAKDLKKVLNEYGWDGEWYWRASKDNGELIGSKSNKEGKIFLNPQNWAIIADVANGKRKKTLLKIIEKYLEDDAGLLLLTPAYSKPDPCIGYLSRYAPGVRENGGIYTHAATWTIWAASKLGNSEMAYRVYRKLCPIYNGQDPDLYQAEPFVTPGNIDGPESPYHGRGSWTWYTGSATWLLKVTFDNLLGIRADYDGLVVDPCFPDDWKEVHMKRLFRGTIYHIRILKTSEMLTHPIEIYLDNKRIKGNMIPMESSKKEVQVLIKNQIEKH